MNLVGNAALLIVKLIGGILGRSQALVADALHSVSDLIISVFLVAGLHVSKVPPDEEHRWGHGQVEFIVSTVIAVLLLFCGVL
ncbi:MAG: cation transporter, partial [Deltaproteobacteria bacterium]